MLRKKPVLLAAAALAVLAGAAAFFLGCSSGSGGRYNVLLISIDSLRRDRLGIYGHRPEYAPEIPVSPNLDKLATEGVVFDNAWTTTSWTLPSHMSLMTGLSDRSHGVIIDDFKIDPLRRTLAQQFDKAGYATAGYFSGPFLNAKYGFGKGFEDYRSAMKLADFTHDMALLNEQLVAQGQPALTQKQIAQRWDHQSHVDITSPRLNEFARSFLDEHAGKDQFFLFVHYFDVHYDYTPPEDLAAQFDPDYAGSMTGVRWFSNPNVRVMDREKGEAVRHISERDLHHVMALYDAEIHWVDRHVGELLTVLKEAGVYEQTLVVVLSDHGDEFFEHGNIGHRSTLYSELTHIPLILKVPGETPPGKRVPETVRMYDVAPTILDYAGVAALPEAEGASFRGFVEGSGGAARTAMGRITHYGAGGGGNVRDSWRDGRYTVTRRLFPGGPSPGGTLPVQWPLNPSTRRPWIEIFDRTQDPGEHRALRPDDPRFQEALAGFCRGFMDSERFYATLRHSDLEDRYAAPASEVEQAALDALGYAGVSDDAPSDQRLLPLGPFPDPCPR